MRVKISATEAFAKKFGHLILLLSPVLPLALHARV